VAVGATLTGDAGLAAVDEGDGFGEVGMPAAKYPLPAV